jgi:hypothetical protein
MALEDGDEGARLLSDLTHLYVLAQACWIDGTVVRQAALAARDEELLAAVDGCLEETSAQVKWLRTRIKAVAPQVLTVEP